MSYTGPALENYTTACLRKLGRTTGKALYDEVSLKFPSLSAEDFADLLYELARNGQIEAYSQPTQENTLHGFLTAWESCLWFYLTIFASVAASLIAYTVPSYSILVPLRWSLGLIFTILLPGFAALKALFPTAELPTYERVALSIGLSLVIDMLSGVAINGTPWGIRLTPILIILAAETIALSTVGLVRQIRSMRTGGKIAFSIS